MSAYPTGREGHITCYEFCFRWLCPRDLGTATLFFFTFLLALPGCKTDSAAEKNDDSPVVEGVPAPESSSVQPSTVDPAGESPDSVTEQGNEGEESTSGDAASSSDASSGGETRVASAKTTSGESASGQTSSDSATSGKTASHSSGKKLRVRSSVSGCLTQKGGESASRSSSRAPMPGGRGGPDTFEAVPQKGALTVTQSFSHACCLTGKTSAIVDGSVVTLTTLLSGTPCRCMCASTIKSSVSLSAGTYTLRVIHEQGDQKREKYTQRVVVP